MFLSELPLAMARRWYVVLLGLLSTLGLALLAFDRVSPTYTATAEVLMLPPSTSVPEGSNPFLALGGLEAAGDVLSRSLSGPTTTARIEEAGGGEDYRVALDPNSPAPLVQIEAEGPTPTFALRTLDLVLAELPRQLIQIQREASVPVGAYMSSTTVTSTAEPESSLKPRIRALVVAVGVGLAGTLLFTALLDAFLARRREAVKHANDRRHHVAESDPQRRRLDRIAGDDVRNVHERTTAAR